MVVFIYIYIYMWRHCYWQKDTQRGVGAGLISICGEHAWIWISNEDPVRQNNIEKNCRQCFIASWCIYTIYHTIFTGRYQILGSIHVQRIPCYCICDNSETLMEYLNYYSQVRTHNRQTEKMSQACSSNKIY